MYSLDILKEKILTANNMLIETIQSLCIAICIISSLLWLGAFHLFAYCITLNKAADIFILAPLNPVFIREKNQENGMWANLAGKIKTGWLHLFESYCSCIMTIIQFA